MDNITPISPKAPPTLHDLLSAIRRDIADMRSELLALRLAQGKLLKAVPKATTLPEVITALATYVEGYFAAHSTPLHLHKITRLFGRKLTRAGSSGFDIAREPELLEKIKILYSDCGAMLFLPQAAWESANDSTRQIWIDSSDAELKGIRTTYRDLGPGDETSEPNSEEEKELTALLGLPDEAPPAKPSGEGTPQ